MSEIIPFPATSPGGGQFFAVDRRAFAIVSSLGGVNPALAFLTIACGSGRTNAGSSWSVNAIEKYTGMSRDKAKAAVRRILEAGIIKQVKGGRHPRYEIAQVTAEPEWIWLPNAIRHRPRGHLSASPSSK